MSLPWLARPPGRRLGANIVIAVGVGLSAMVFALADPALRPLPYADPDRLVAIGFSLPAPGPRSNPADVPSLASWQARTDLFVGVAAFDDRGWLRVRVADRIVPLRAVAATDNLFAVLGLHAPIPESDPSSAWVSRRAAATLSGGALQGGVSAPIVPEGVLRVRGVLPEAFLLPEAHRIEPVDALVALSAGSVIRIDGVSSRALTIVARLRPGISPPMVEAALNVSMAPVQRRVTVVPLSLALNARLHGLAMGALWASGLLVFVCWANVFSLAVTRGLYRHAEMVTRTALGATPMRLMRLLSGEALRVAALGCATAYAVTWMALAIVLPAMPPQFATLGAPAVTTRVGLFIVVGAVIAGGSWFVASLLAWTVSRQRRALHVTSRDGRLIRIVRFAVIAGQLGAASVLLVGSALLGRSYLNLARVDAGLDDRVHTLTIAHNPNVPVALQRDVVERTLRALRASGGVAAAGASAGGLLNGRNNAVSLVIVDGRHVFLNMTFVAGDYFAAMRPQFVAGAAPAPGDDAVVVTEQVAREFVGAGGPVGATIPIVDSEAQAFRPLRVVGVVRDVRSRSLATPEEPNVYIQIQARGGFGRHPQTTYVLRLAEHDASVSSFERVVREVDPLAIVLDAGSIGARLGRSIRDRTFATLVIGLFAAASIVVAVLGLAGVVAYTVVRRTREMAIRLALGATAKGITTLVVRDAVIAATVGMVGGMVASVWLSRALESLLYGVRPSDPTTLLLTAATLVVVVVTAATLPGIRAGRTAPASALRIE